MATTHNFSIVTDTETISGEMTIGPDGVKSEILLSTAMSEQKVKCITDLQGNFRHMHKLCGDITSISITEKT